jgi:hypothetical protein
MADVPTWQEALRLPLDELAIRLLRFLVELQSTGEKLNAWNGTPSESSPGGPASQQLSPQAPD